MATWNTMRGSAGGICAVNIVRTLGIFMALAALSFVLGFFVLARLMPGATRPVISATVPTSATQPFIVPKEANSPPPAAAPSLQPTKSPIIVATRGTPSQTHAGSTPGPTLDPVNDPPAEARGFRVQKPRKVESSEPPSAPSNADERDSVAAARTDRDNGTASGSAVEGKSEKSIVQDTPPVSHRKKRRHHPALTSDETPARAENHASENSDDNATARAEKPRKSRRARKTTSDEGDSERDNSASERKRRSATESVAEHKRRSTGEGDSARRHRAAEEVDSEASHSTFYRVHIGSFHSRDAASEEARRARSKGFETQIVPYTRGGRTLYRVQSGAYRDRTRAEAAKQSMQDADLDARISEQQR